MTVIDKYSAYFHDGSLIDIEHKDEEISLSLESAEVDPSIIQDNIQLSDHETIKGKLHLKQIKLIYINEIKFSGFLKMKYDSGKIFDLEISNNIIELAVSWENFPPNSPVNDFSTIKIIAEKISWETIPDLADPFW